MEETLQTLPPDPYLIGLLSGLARTFTANYELTLVPWQPLPEVMNDWPQWRLIPKQNLLQFVPEDLTRLDERAVTGLLFESVMLAATFDPKVVEEVYRSQGPFWALITVLAIPRSRALFLQRYPGFTADFTLLDDGLYGPIENEKLLPQPSAFLQFLEGALHEGRRGQRHPQVAGRPRVREALEETHSLRLETMQQADQNRFYETVRDRIWPVAVRLLEEDIHQELFWKLQRGKEFRKELGLSPRQILYAVEGRLLLTKLSEKQRARFTQLLGGALQQLSEEEQWALRRSLQSRLAEGLRKMRDQMPTGLLPPLAEEPFPDEQGGLLGAQRKLLSQAGTALQVSSDLAERLSRMAAEAAGLEEEWGTLSNLAKQLHREITDLKAEAGRAVEGTGFLLQRLQRAGGADLPGTERMQELTKDLHEENQKIGREAAALERAVEGFSKGMERIAGKQLSAGEIKELAERAQQIHANAERFRKRLEKLQSQAEEAELTALDLLSEGARMARSQTQGGRVLQAAEAIAGWADPVILKRKAMSEAVAQTLSRILRRMRQMQERANAGEPMEQGMQEIFRKELEELGKKIGEIMERFGIPVELQEEWREKISQMDVSKLQEQLARILGEGAQEAETGPPEPPDPYGLVGADLLKVVPPAAPPERPVSPAGEAITDKPPVAAVATGPSDLRAREREAMVFQQLAQRQRAGVVQAQIPRVRRYLALRRSLISTASAQLFQWGAMNRRTKEQTDLLEGDDVDEENLALVPAGTSRIFMEEGASQKKGEGDVLALVIDVSESTLWPGDLTDEEVRQLYRDGTYEQRQKEAEKNGTRRIDYITDLAFTLGEAAAKYRKQRLQISIFSSWKEGASRVVKRADEPWGELKAAEVVDAILNSSHKGTDDAQAVSEEIARLREIAGPRAKKRIWVLSDGVGSGPDSMKWVLQKNKDILVFGWGLGPGMKNIEQTFGPRGIWVPRMSELVRTGMRVFQKQARGSSGTGAGLEEAAEGLELGLDGWPLDFPRLHPIQDRPGAGELKFHREDGQVWFEVDGIRIDPPPAPKVTLSDWTVGKLQQMWDVYRKHPKGRENTLLVYGQPGIGKSLYARYLWEIYRGWLKGRAERMGPGLEKLKEQVIALADTTKTQVVTFHEKLRKADLTQRLGFGEGEVDENSWTPSDLVNGGVAGDQVILSEVNRAPDDLLAELDEPLAQGEKTLHDRVARFHPNSRFVAAINPAEGQVAYQIGYAGRHLSGQFLGHFDKVTLDYPRPKLEDGTDNPEYALFVEHEKQVLQEVRRRKLDNGQWAVSDEVIAQLVILAGLVREDAMAGQAPFIVTTRALVRMVEMLDRFPHLLKRIPDVFFNSYWVDDSVHGSGTRAHLLALIERIFKPAAWPAHQAWPSPRAPVGPPQVVDGQITYPHWPADVRIPRGPGTGAYIPREILFQTEGNLWKLEDLLMDVALKRNIMIMGDTDTGQSYFVRLLAKVLRRNLIVLTMSQGFKVRDMLVMRWFSGGRTRWKDSLALAHLRPEKVQAEGAPIILWDRGENGDPGTLVAFNDMLQERQVLLSSGEEFSLPEEAVIAMARTPPRAPYEYEEHSGDLFDRFTHHSLRYLPREEETDILHAHHPELARDSLHKVVRAAHFLRDLYQKQELFEPPGFGMTFAAAARLAQYPDRQVMLPDLMVEAYGSIQPGAETAIRKALQEAALNVPIHPLWDPELIRLTEAFPQVRWDPEVKEDRALWRLGLGLISTKIERVLRTGDPDQIGWGLQLRRVSNTAAELVPLEAGFQRPFDAYDRLGTALHQTAMDRGISAYRLGEEGVFYRTAESTTWKKLDRPFGPGVPEAGLWEFLSSRGFKKGAALTIELPVDSQAAWVDLAWALDPVTLRRVIPPARRLQGISRPIQLKVNGEHLLENLRGFAVGLDQEELSPGFLIRPHAAGLEEDTAALIRKVPVLAGFISHGDDEESLEMLKAWVNRLGIFLKERPAVKHLLVVQEVGAPFIAQTLWRMGVDLGQLVEVGRRDPEGFERVVRPAFDQAMAASREISDGWWSQIYAGEMPKISDEPWHQLLFSAIHVKQQLGYEIHSVVEQPAAEDWWKFLLYEEGVASAAQDLSGPQVSPEERKRWVEALAMLGESVQARDESGINGQLVPLLEEIFVGEEPEDLEGEPLKPEELAVLIPRGRFHALHSKPLLEAHFTEVTSLQSEDLVEWKLFPELLYDEALVRGGYRPGQGPPEVEKLLDDRIAEIWNQKEKTRAAAEAAAPEAGLEEAGKLVILTPATAEISSQVASLKSGLPLRVAVMVEDDAQEARLRAGMEESGITPVLWRVINLSRAGQTLSQALQSLRSEAAKNSFGVWVIERFDQLGGLGRFLKIPDLSFRVWLGQVQRRLEREA